MSNLSVKHNRSFSPAKLVIESKPDYFYREEVPGGLLKK
jgi:hypothetical protein